MAKIKITGRRGSREVTVTCDDNAELELRCKKLRSLGYQVLTISGALSNSEHQQLNVKINRLCREYLAAHKRNT